MNEVNWVIPALASPIVYAGISFGDKFIISRQGLTLGAFFLFVGIAQFLTAGFVLLFNGWPQQVSVIYLLSSFGGGFIWGGALMLMFLVLRREEVSRVMPVWQSSPIFTAILAFLILGENLLWFVWLAILLVVAGAVAVSIEKRKGAHSAFALRPTFFILIFSAAMVAVAQLLLKTGSDELSVWNNLAFRALGLFTSMGLPWVRPKYVKSLFQWAKTPNHSLLIIFSEGLGPFVGNLFFLMAIDKGSVSLASALFGTRPIFILAGALILNFVAKDVFAETFTKWSLIVKVVSTMAVVVGIVIISTHSQF